MEKAAEVYTRLKSRVLGPKLEAIQKANKAGTEKDKGEAEKGQEKLAGGETRNEKGEEETNAGNVPCVSQRCWTQTGTQHFPLGLQTRVALGLGGSRVSQPHVSPPVLFHGARRGKGRDGECWRHWEQRANPTPTLGASGLFFGPAAPLPAPALPRELQECGAALGRRLRLLAGAGERDLPACPGTSWRCCRSLPRGADGENPLWVRGLESLGPFS